MAWIETNYDPAKPFLHCRSPPARVAWIETICVVGGVRSRYVATREGGVDRNIKGLRPSCLVEVATREGGVDRNMSRAETPVAPLWVATREGGVDRNDTRAPDAPVHLVATREGGVDRNVIYCDHVSYRKRSPPARVAWIET